MLWELRTWPEVVWMVIGILGIFVNGMSLGQTINDAAFLQDPRKGSLSRVLSSMAIKHEAVRMCKQLGIILSGILILIQPDPVTYQHIVGLLIVMVTLGYISILTSYLSYSDWKGRNVNALIYEVDNLSAEKWKIETEQARLEHKDKLFRASDQPKDGKGVR